MRTLAGLVDFHQLSENVRAQRLALGVVATPAHSSRSVVFHQGGVARHRNDPLRGIEYVATPELRLEHILASSAIPALFPAAQVTVPEPAAGWYFDGGPRLNTPIKPALWLGAKRVIVIALNSIAPSRTPPPKQQPNFYVGAAHLLHAALGDPLAQDIRTLANTNALIAAQLAANSANGRSGHRGTARQQQPGTNEPIAPVPYIFIAPEDPAAIGEIARLIELGQADAQRWIDEHPATLWQLDPLPAWSQPPNGHARTLTPPYRSRVRAITPPREIANIPPQAGNQVD